MLHAYVHRPPSHKGYEKKLRPTMESRFPGKSRKVTRAQWREKEEEEKRREEKRENEKGGETRWQTSCLAYCLTNSHRSSDSIPNLYHRISLLSSVSAFVPSTHPLPHSPPPVRSVEQIEFSIIIVFLPSPLPSSPPAPVKTVQRAR